MPVANFTLPQLPQAGGPQMGLQPPGAIEAQTNNLEQQQLLQALMQSQQSLAPEPVKSGKYNTLDLTGVANALASQRERTELENSRKKSADLQGKYQQGLVAGLTGYDPNDPSSLQSARTSPYPEIRKLADEDWKTLQSRFDKLGERSSLTSVQAAGGDMRRLAPRQEQKFDQGTVASLTEGQPPQLLTPPYTAPAMDSTGTMVQTNPFTNKSESVSKSPTVNIALGNRPLDEAMKLLPADYDKAQGLAKTVQGTETALDALKQGAKTGYGAETMQSIRTAVSMITGVQFDQSTPFGVLAKTLAGNVLNEFGGNLGGKVSDNDVRFMKVAQGGTETDPAALERILAIRAGLAMKQIDIHNKNVGLIADNPKNDVGDFTRQRFTVARPGFTFAFNSPDSRASFESAFTGKSLATAKEQDTAQIKQWQKEGRIPPDKPDAASEADRKRRLEALGLTYTPPPGQ